MDRAVNSDLAEFYEFLGKHLDDPLRSPEDVLEEWRLQRRNIAEYEQNVAAIRAALEDMEAGDHGTDAREFLRELDAELSRRLAT